MPAFREDLINTVQTNISMLCSSFIISHTSRKYAFIVTTLEYGKDGWFEELDSLKPSYQ